MCRMARKTLFYALQYAYARQSDEPDLNKKYDRLSYHDENYLLPKDKHSQRKSSKKRSAKRAPDTDRDTLPAGLTPKPGDLKTPDPERRYMEKPDGWSLGEARPADLSLVARKNDFRKRPVSTPQTVKQERANQTRLSGQDRLANRLPRGFIKNDADPMRYFFVGFYAGSGCHSTTGPGFKVGLKACEFMSLYNLLRRCGVAKPNLKYVLH